MVHCSVDKFMYKFEEIIKVVICCQSDQVNFSESFINTVYTHVALFNYSSLCYLSSVNSIEYCKIWEFCVVQIFPQLLAILFRNYYLFCFQEKVELLLLSLDHNKWFFRDLYSGKYAHFRSNYFAAWTEA